MAREKARSFVVDLATYCKAPYDFEVTRHAWRIQDRFGFSWWDCVLLASADLAQCAIFFSEDLQHGRQVGGLIIINPFPAQAGPSPKD